MGRQLHCFRTFLYIIQTGTIRFCESTAESSGLIQIYKHPFRLKFDSIIKEPFSDKDYEHYFKNIGIEKPDNMIDKIVYIRDKFNAECCRNLHLKDLLIFNYEAYGKKTVINMETPYYYHGSNFDGLICEIPAKRKMTNVVICNPELRYHVTVTIICNDTELTNQIIAGLDPSPFLAGDVL